MKDEKDLQNQDSDALELQIDKMIDELFVGKEEPALGEQPGGAAEVGAAGEETAFGMVTEGMDQVSARAEPDVVGMEPAAGAPQTELEVPSVATGPAGPTARTAGMAPEWDMGAPGAQVTDRGVSAEALEPPVGAAVEPVRAVPAQPQQWQGPGVDAEATVLAGAAEAEGPAARGRDEVGQTLHNSLKENILSLEWEISPQNIEHFVEAMKPVQAHLAANPSAVKVGTMMVSVLSYIRRVGRSALPLSIQVLQNGVDFLGMVLLPEEQANGEKRKELLATFVDHYRVLKFQIEQQRDKAPRSKAQAPAPRPAVSAEIAEYVRSVVDDTVASLVETAVAEEVRRLKQEILEMMADRIGSEPVPALAGIPQPAPGTVPSAVQAPVTTAARVAESVLEEVLTVTLGDQSFNVPKALVANVYTPSPRKLTKVIESRTFRISDLLSLFGSATKDLMGPLRSASPYELRNRRFDLVETEKAFGVPGCLQPRQLVLISDGKKGYGFLADATIWRTAEIPQGLTARIVAGAETGGGVLAAPPDDHPFLNVAKAL